MFVCWQISLVTDGSLKNSGEKTPPFWMYHPWYSTSWNPGEIDNQLWLVPLCFIPLSSQPPRKLRSPPKMGGHFKRKGSSSKSTIFQVTFMCWVEPFSRFLPATRQTHESENGVLVWSHQTNHERTVYLTNPPESDRCWVTLVGLEGLIVHLRKTHPRNTVGRNPANHLGILPSTVHQAWTWRYYFHKTMPSNGFLHSNVSVLDEFVWRNSPLKNKMPTPYEEVKL